MIIDFDDVPISTPCENIHTDDIFFFFIYIRSLL